jgi:CBS domain-containing protein
MISIQNVMTTPAYSVRPTATVRQTIAFLTRHHIGGAPVVDDDGELVGMITDSELIEVAFDSAVKDATIANYMTTDVHALGIDDSLSRAAQLFVLYKYRRLPVVENGKLAGIVTRRDLMNNVLQTNGILAEPLIELIPSLARACDGPSAPGEELSMPEMSAWEIS